ncbi:MAG: hypothetical protein WC895_04180 [Candidatus Shapirobacteria bacterium]|jgi:hypothetical protein
MNGETGKVNLHENVPPVTDEYILDFIKTLRSHGLETAIRSAMDRCGIEPEYSNVSEGALADQREKLDTMPGMMIANHPGRFDTLIVLDMLKKRIAERRDVKFLVAGGPFYELLAEIFGKESVLSAEINKDPIGKSVKHIVESGGLLMIYPSGSQDMKFKSGFRSICERVPDDSMVYAVQIDEYDLAVASAQPTDGDKHRIHVHEAFTNADEWRAELAESRPAERNRRMTQLYLSKFAAVNARKTYMTESPEDRKKREEQTRIVSDIFQRANENGIPLYLFASFADDVLLHDGVIAEFHGDIDAICLREHVGEMNTILAEIGCDTEEETDNQNYYSNSLPLKMRARRGDVEIDIPILDFDDIRQEPYYQLTNNDGKTYRIYFGKNFL